jgi:hypothetical protein
MALNYVIGGILWLMLINYRYPQSSIFFSLVSSIFSRHIAQQKPHALNSPQSR